ncbi:MAG TPA: Dyp-type peroxidase [Acetobacteraceae bacterium]|jgi:putative iron-dependent peroxidase
MQQAADKSAAVPQPVTRKLTRAAIFLVVTADPDPAACAAVRSLVSDIGAIIRPIGFREPEGDLSCVVGFGSDVWERLFGLPRPAELHPFREIRTATRHAVATPGDLLFHIRAERIDLCFELATSIMTTLGSAVAIADEVHGFQYFDRRDLLGFVDGTENPEDQDAIQAALVGSEDPDFAAGSYVVVQKYLHDLPGWNGLSTAAQEHIIGRTKLGNEDLDPAIKPSAAHNALTTIVEGGSEVKILRDNMPFGQPGHGEFGTYFIGYSRSPRTIEQMLENMFIGRPPGNYDRLLDFSRAVTGTLFFAPAASFLQGVTSDAKPALPDGRSDAEHLAQPIPSMRDGSLGIGTLKGQSQR